jgi:superfamily II DNA/RNA helicase
LHDPAKIRVAPDKITHDAIEQRLHMVDSLQHKHRLLQHLCADTTVSKAIIFSATKRDADSLAHSLNTHGFAAAALHGDMTQNARNRTMLNMRRGKIRLLVATDVAARGLDITGISHVINFDLPRFAEDYVHRIGRTGRAGESGIAISFAARSDLAYLQRIERYMGQNLPMQVIPGLEPRIPVQSPGNGGNYSLPGHSAGKSYSSKNGRNGSRPVRYKEQGTPSVFSGMKKRNSAARSVAVEYIESESAGASRRNKATKRRQEKFTNRK